MIKQQQHTRVVPLSEAGQVDASVGVHVVGDVEAHVGRGPHVAEGRRVRVRVRQEQLHRDVVAAALVGDGQGAAEGEQVLCKK